MRKKKAELVEMVEERDATIADLHEQLADRDARIQEYLPTAPEPLEAMIEIEILNPARMIALGALMAGFVAVLYLISSAR